MPPKHTEHKSEHLFTKLSVVGLNALKLVNSKRMKVSVIEARQAGQGTEKVTRARINEKKQFILPRLKQTFLFPDH